MFCSKINTGNGPSDLAGNRRPHPHEYRHPARQLLGHVAALINQRAAAGVVTRLVKVKAHAGDPLNEAADAASSQTTCLFTVQPGNAGRTLLLQLSHAPIIIGTWLAQCLITLILDPLVSVTDGLHLCAVIYTVTGNPDLFSVSYVHCIGHL